MRPGYSVFFDLDSTLLDNSGNWETVVHVCQQISAYKTGLDADRLMRANEESWPRYWAEVQEDWMLGRTDSVSVSREMWRRSLEICGCSSNSVIESAVRIHKQAERKGFRLYEDVAGTMDILQKAGLPMALITNGPSDLQRSKLNALHIAHWFDAIVISGEFGRAKPDVSVFEIAIREMGIEPKEVWHVGDNLDTDIAGARAAGLRAVWLNRSGKSRTENDPEPHFELRTLVNLPGILDID